MSRKDFENFICLVGQVVNKKNTKFINAIIVNVLGDNTEMQAGLS
jgi:hypothetical protein